MRWKINYLPINTNKRTMEGELHSPIRGSTIFSLTEEWFRSFLEFSINPINTKCFIQFPSNENYGNNISIFHASLREDNWWYLFLFHGYNSCCFKLNQGCLYTSSHSCWSRQSNFVFDLVVIFFWRENKNKNLSCISPIIIHIIHKIRRVNLLFTCSEVRQEWRERIVGISNE